MFGRMIVSNKRGFAIDMTFDLSGKELECIHAEGLTPQETEGTFL